MKQYQKVCRITRSVPNYYTCIFLDFVRRFSSYVKGLLKTKQYNSVLGLVRVYVKWPLDETNIPEFQLLAYLHAKHFKTGDLAMWINKVDNKAF